MKSWSSYPSGMCLEAVWKAFGSIPSTGPHAGQYPYALKGWEYATQRHPGDRNVPYGAPVYFTAGSNGYGHICISLGGNKVVSTDIPSGGRVGITTIEDIERRWGRTYLGYTTDFLGHQLVNLGSAPQPSQPSAPASSGGAYNPFGIGDARGLQKIARLGGYKGDIDNKFGAGSKAGFAQWLRNNWGYRGNDELGPVMWAAIARWLRARWGYVGNDIPGPVMRAALQNASNRNLAEL